MPTAGRISPRDYQEKKKKFKEGEEKSFLNEKKGEGGPTRGRTVLEKV